MTNELQSILDSKKDMFLDKLEMFTKQYIAIGHHNNNSPMWLQLQSTTYMDDRIAFRSSQSSIGGFSIPCTEDELEYISFSFSEAYDYFKYLKYTFLKEHYPDVFNDLNRSEIEIFLKMYSE